MHIALLTGLIIALGFGITIVLRQAYAILLVQGGRPGSWMVAATILGILVWTVSAVGNWNVLVPAWACMLAVLMSSFPKYGRQEDPGAESEMSTFLDETKTRQDRLWYKLGLAAFVLASIVSWVGLYHRGT